MNGIVSPWWQRLPDDFYLHAVATELDEPYRLKVLGTAAIDVVLRTGLGTLIATAMGPAVATRAWIQRERERLRFYAPYADRGRAEEVFARPPATVAVREESAPWCSLGLRRITSRRLRFESPFTPLNPALAASYARFRQNREACALHLIHDDGPRPTLIFLHGYALDACFVNSWAFSLPWLHAKGYDVLLATLPFHGDRREWCISTSAPT